MSLFDTDVPMARLNLQARFPYVCRNTPALVSTHLPPVCLRLSPEYRMPPQQHLGDWRYEQKYLTHNCCKRSEKGCHQSLLFYQCTS